MGTTTPQLVRVGNRRQLHELEVFSAASGTGSSWAGRDRPASVPKRHRAVTPRPKGRGVPIRQRSELTRVFPPLPPLDSLAKYGPSSGNRPPTTRNYSGEGGIRTRGGVLAPRPLSKRVPSATRSPLRVSTPAEKRSEHASPPSRAQGKAVIRRDRVERSAAQDTPRSLFIDASSAGVNGYWSNSELATQRNSLTAKGRKFWLRRWHSYRNRSTT